MSQISGGSVHIDLVAENEQLKRKLQEAQARVASLQSSTEAGTEATVQGFQRSIRAVTSFVGSLTAAIGVGTTFYALGRQIREVWDEAFTSGTANARAFLDALNTIDPSVKLRATSERLTKLQGELAKLLEKADEQGRLPLLDEERGKKLQDEIAALQVTERVARQQLRAQEREKETRAAEKERQAEEKKAAEDAARADERAFEDRIAAHREERRQAQREMVERREQEEEDHKRALERAEELAQANVDAARRAREEWERTREAMTQGFGVGDIVFPNLGAGSQDALMSILMRMNR